MNKRIEQYNDRIDRLTAHAGQLCETLRAVLAELQKTEAERDAMLPPDDFLAECEK